MYISFLLTLSIIIGFLPLTLVRNANFLLKQKIESNLCSELKQLNLHTPIMRNESQSDSFCLSRLTGITFISNIEDKLLDEKIKQNSPFYKDEVKLELKSPNLLLTTENNSFLLIEIKSNRVIWRENLILEAYLKKGILWSTPNLIRFLIFYLLFLYPRKLWKCYCHRKEERNRLSEAINNIRFGRTYNEIDILIDLSTNSKCKLTKMRSLEILKALAENI